MALLTLLAQGNGGQEFHPPAGQRYAQVASTGTILPGGRVLQSLGVQIDSGPGTFGVSISPKGTVATSDIGPERFGLTELDPTHNLSHIWARTPHSSLPEQADPTWKSVSTGIAFDSDRSVWVSEGSSGRIRLLNTKSGAHEKIIDLNRSVPGQEKSKDSFTGEMVLDPIHRILYVVDPTNRRIIAVDTKKGQVLSSVPVGHPLSGIALAPDRNTAYVSSPGGGVAIVDVRNPAEPVVRKWLGEDGEPFPSSEADQDSSVLAVGDRVYVSSPREDTVRVLSATGADFTAEIPLRIPPLEMLRGIRPSGMAFDPLTKWLLVAESGLNAVAVIDTEKNELLGHLPVGWAPKRIAISGDRVYVANSLGRGTGPNLRRPLLELGEPPSLHHGSISTFIVPAPADLAKMTRLVYLANGLLPDPQQSTSPALPDGIRHILLIVKSNSSFDEMLGDVREANNPSNRRVQAVPQLARYGMHGLAEGKKLRLSVKDAAVTPNQHALVQRWAFSDNFYADPDGIPDLDSSGPLWKHLELHGIAYKAFQDDDETLPDQTRADRVIASLENAKQLPPFLLIRLPNDGVVPGVEERHPYRASWIADSDLAVGRIVQALSHTPWWRDAVVFVTEQTAEGGLDHIDSHRTVLLAAGPWIRQNYVTHTNSDMAGLWKTIFTLLHVPPLTLRDATARTINDIFAATPDNSPFEALPADKRIFDPDLLRSQ
jgi:DNA-binding beta-propeller fold protein YncE